MSDKPPSTLLSDPKTTISGVVLAVGLGMMHASTVAGAPSWLGWVGVMLSTVGAVLLGKSARDSA